jgi:hypothetical protein
VTWTPSRRLAATPPRALIAFLRPRADARKAGSNTSEPLPGSLLASLPEHAPPSPRGRVVCGATSKHLERHMEPLTPAWETAERIRRKEISASEAVEDALGRLDALGQLNAFVTSIGRRQRARPSTRPSPAALTGPARRVPIGVGTLSPWQACRLPTGHGLIRTTSPTTTRSSHPAPRGGRHHPG